MQLAILLAENKELAYGSPLDEFAEMIATRSGVCYELPDIREAIEEVAIENNFRMIEESETPYGSIYQ